MNELILMSHVALGVGCIVATVWLLVDVLNAHADNLTRIRWVSRLVAACMWLSFVVGGYWYVVEYKVDKAVILKGPWPFAHNLFMETKEHFVITLLLVATYLPIAAANNLAVNRGARRLVVCLAVMVLVLGLMAEGNGGVIAMGVKTGLQGHPH
jgi:hypothetical protein